MSYMSLLSFVALLVFFPNLRDLARPSATAMAAFYKNFREKLTLVTTNDHRRLFCLKEIHDNNLFVSKFIVFYSSLTNRFYSFQKNCYP